MTKGTLLMRIAKENRKYLNRTFIGLKSHMSNHGILKWIENIINTSKEGAGTNTVKALLLLEISKLYKEDVIDDDIKGRLVAMATSTDRDMQALGEKLIGRFRAKRLKIAKRKDGKRWKNSITTTSVECSDNGLNCSDPS